MISDLWLIRLVWDSNSKIRIRYTVVTEGWCIILTWFDWELYSLVMRLVGQNAWGWRILCAVMLVGDAYVTRYICQTECFGWLETEVTISLSQGTATVIILDGLFVFLVWKWSLLYLSLDRNVATWIHSTQSKDLKCRQISFSPKFCFEWYSCSELWLTLATNNLTEASRMLWFLATNNLSDSWRML